MFTNVFQFKWSNMYGPLSSNIADWQVDDKPTIWQCANFWFAKNSTRNPDVGAVGSPGISSDPCLCVFLRAKISLQLRVACVLGPVIGGCLARESLSNR
jgi:hypothetical protein